MKRIPVYILAILISAFYIHVLSYLDDTLGRIQDSVYLSYLDIRDSFYSIFPSLIAKESFPDNISHAYYIDTIHLSSPYVRIDTTSAYVISDTSKKQYKMLLWEDDRAEAIDEMTLSSKLLNRKLYNHYLHSLSIINYQDSYIRRNKDENNVYFDFKYTPKCFLVILLQESDVKIEEEGDELMVDLVFEEDYQIYLKPIWSKRHINKLRKEISLSEDENSLDDYMSSIPKSIIHKKQTLSNE